MDEYLFRGVCSMLGYLIYAKVTVREHGLLSAEYKVM